MIELDVHRIEIAKNLSELLVIHDDTLNRTTSRGGKVDALSSHSLEYIDAGDGNPIPLLSEVIALINEFNKEKINKVSLNIELKGNSTGALTARYLKNKLTPPIMISSFKHQEIMRYREIDDQTPVAPLFDRWNPDWAEIANSLDAFAVNCSQKTINTKRIQMIKNQNLKCYVYTVNSVSEAQELLALGVDGIFTDYPNRMKQWLL